METTAAIEEMLKRSGMSRYALSKAMGKAPTYVQNTISRGGSVTVDNLAKMAHIMGFRVIIDGEGESIEICEEVTGDADSD